MAPREMRNSAKISFKCRSRESFGKMKAFNFGDPGLKINFRCLSKSFEVTRFLANVASSFEWNASSGVARK